MGEEVGGPQPRWIGSQEAPRSSCARCPLSQRASVALRASSHASSSSSSRRPSRRSLSAALILSLFYILAYSREMQERWGVEKAQSGYKSRQLKNYMKDS